MQICEFRRIGHPGSERVSWYLWNRGQLRTESRRMRLGRQTRERNRRAFKIARRASGSTRRGSRWTWGFTRLSRTRIRGFRQSSTIAARQRLGGGSVLCTRVCRTRICFARRRITPDSRLGRRTRNLEQKIILDFYCILRYTILFKGFLMAGYHANRRVTFG